MRRLLDRIVACAVLVATSPILLIASIAVFLGDGRSPIFSQTRLGKDEREFKLYKLRTMRLGTPSVTSHELDDSALTPLGGTLRRLKLDELPQMINVIRGDMALVGPRPGLPSDQRLLTARRTHGVFEVLPGITGIAQIRGIDMSTPEILAMVDAEYLTSQTLATDIRLMFQTATGRGSGDALGRTP